MYLKKKGYVSLWGMGVRGGGSNSENFVRYAYSRGKMLTLCTECSANYNNSPKICSTKVYFWFKYNLGQKYYAPQVRPDRGSNS